MGDVLSSGPESPQEGGGGGRGRRVPEDGHMAASELPAHAPATSAGPRCLVLLTDTTGPVSP